jgi:hypothetical protein
MMRVALSQDRFTACQLPRSLETLLANAPDAERREQVRLAFTGSAMDTIDRFSPTSSCIGPWDRPYRSEGLNRQVG